MPLSVAAEWPTIKSEKISSDGKYIVYLVSSQKSGGDFFVQATDNSLKQQLQNATEASFTDDSRLLIFKNSHDSLGIMDLVNYDILYIPGILSFSINEGSDGHYLTYILKEPAKEMVMINLVTRKEIHYSNICNDYIFDAKCHLALIHREPQEVNNTKHSLVLINLSNSSSLTIFKGNVPENMFFDEGGTQAAFFTQEEKNGKLINTLRYYKYGQDSSILLTSPSSLGMNNMALAKTSSDIYGGKMPFFSKDGDKIFLYLKIPNQQKSVKTDTSITSVEVWNYKDVKYHPENKDNFVFLSSININTKTVLRLEQDPDILSCAKINKGGDGNYIIVKSSLESDHYDKNSRENYSKLFLVSTKDGAKKLLDSNSITDNFDIGFSPSGRYVVWYDRAEKQWFTYCIANGRKTDVTRRISKSLAVQSDLPNHLPGPTGIAGWAKNDSVMFIYDQWDIWKVDPEGCFEQLNITNGYGWKYHIQFKLMNFTAKDIRYNFNNDDYTIIDLSDTLLLSGFNLRNKDNGIYKLFIERHSDPNLLIKGKKSYYFSYINKPEFPYAVQPFFPLKAKRANKYLFKIMSEKEFPNLYATSDFVNNVQLTDLNPQKKYNWINSELLHWQKPDGKIGEGILYKPDDFNPNRKYPVIFYCYEKNADALNWFFNPDLSCGTLNIPWFVSNGYLVCVPNIDYNKLADPGDCALESVVSSVKYLSKLSWVDASKLGMQGHSYGGFETEYIVTHSHLFAAVAPAAGFSDLVSSYAQKNSRFNIGAYFETGQGRIGVALAKNYVPYITNSPVLKVKNVTAPVLIMHNKTDWVADFDQDDEFYKSLVRMGKKVWLLSYDNGNHILENEKDKLDYSIRLAQFFGYYLKGEPAPSWMTIGVDPNLKGQDDGLEMDTTKIEP